MTAPRFACAWLTSCQDTAVKRRFDPLVGSYRPACAKHIASATPFELLPLVDDDAQKAASS